MNNPLGEMWAKVPADTKKYGTVGGASIAGFFLLYQLVAANGPPEETNRREAITRTVLTEESTEALSLQGMQARLDAMNKQNLELTRQVGRLERRSGTTNINKADLERLRMELERLVDQRMGEVESLPSYVDYEPEASEQPMPGNPVPRFVEVAPQANMWALSPTADGARNSNLSTGIPSASASSPAPRVVRTASAPSRSFREIQPEETPVVVQEAETAEDEGFYVPAGTLVSGTLITGMDAPTNTNAAGEPLPVLLRVKQSAILPNRYRMDIKECFILASGFGQLSSERAFFRATKAGCVRTDGTIVEADDPQMNAIGEDGKVGVRGRVVSREGKLLAEAAWASFLKAFAAVFTKRPVALPVVASVSDVTQTSQFENPLSKESLQSATLTGAGEALDRLAQYYLDMAEQIFPIIEIDAGRRIEFLVSKGTHFKPVKENMGGKVVKSPLVRTAQ